MFRWTPTPRALACVARIEALREALDRVGPLPRSWQGRLRRDLEAEAVAASTRMEGVPITVDEARRILAGDAPASVSPGDVALVEGYRDAMRYVLARADDPHFAWHTELVLAIHDRVLAGSRAGGAGRIRVRQNWVSDGVTGAQVYLPPPAGDVPGHLAALMSWLAATDAPPAVAAAVAHIGLAAIHPFADGNGRTARIVASLVMYRAGFQAPRFTSLEEWWGRHVASYYAAFACLGSRWNPDADVTPFVEAHACAQVAQGEALSLHQVTAQAIWTVLVDLTTHGLGLDERAAHALYDAVHARVVTNRYYRGLAGVSPVTSSHDLGKLKAAGMLEQRGAGRGARYVGTERLIQAVATGTRVDAGGTDGGRTIEEARDALVTAVARRLHGESA